MKKALLYLIGPPVAFGILVTILFPILWFFEFTYNWIVYDDVIALGEFEAQVRKAYNAASTFFLGAFFGFMMSLWAISHRLLKGTWPGDE